MKENIAEPLLLEYDNPYWKDNPEYFGLLYKLIFEKPIGYHTVLLSERKSDKWFSKYRDKSNDIFKDVYKWILESTGFLNDPFWELATKCYCILNGLTSIDQFPKCLTDGKFIKQNIYSITVGFKKHYCSAKCRANNPEFKKRMAEQRCKKYGNIFGPVEKIKKTKLERYGDENYHNSEKASYTRKNFSAERKDEIEQKKRQTWNKKYGVDNPMKNADVQKRQQETCFANHGRFYGFDYDKIKVINNQKLNCDWPLQSKSVREKIIQTWFSIYGVSNPMQTPEIQRKQRRRYVYNDKTFDSSSELAFYIWLDDNGIRFKYNESNGIPYEFEGKIHMYFPDFQLLDDNIFVEIKGIHFFRPNGTMFNPFRYKDQSDADYERSCRKYEAKYQCMIRNNVRIILDPSDEIYKYKKYVEDKYGINFLDNCRKVNS